MFRSLAISGKATATKSLKEKWLSRVQSAREKGENGIGGPSTVTCIPDVSHPFSLMTDASDNLHPCTYFSKTFSAMEQNDDIYDHELLAVILALAKW